MFIVLFLCGNFGNMLIVVLIFVGILIMLLLILSCFFFGVCISFWNVSLGVSSLYFNLLRLKNVGFGGNCMLLIIV